MPKTIMIDPPEGKKKSGKWNLGKWKPKNWIKTAAITSGILWVTGLGGAFALKFVDLSPAGVDAKAASHGEDPAHAEADGETALANVPAAPADPKAGAHGEAHGEDTHAPKAGAHEESHGENHGEGHGKAPAESHHESHAKTHVEAPSLAHAESHAKAHGHAPSATAAPDKAHGHSHDTPAETHAHAAPPAQVESTEEAPPAVVGPASDDERNALRELAEIHASNGNLEKAVYPLRKLMVVSGKDVALLSLATQVFLGTGNYREALQAANKALRHAAPGRVDLEVAAAMARYRLGEVHEAIQDAEASLKKHPKDLDLLTALGTMQIEQGPAHPHYGEALEQALKLKPSHVPALYQQGRKAQLEGDYKDAEAIFRKVLKLDPGHAKAHGQLGTALYHLRKEEEARKQFEIALKANPKDYNTWFNLGEAQLAQAGRETRPARIRTLRTEALASYLKAVEWNRDHAEAHFRIGVLLNGNGQYKEAIRHLEAARKRDGYHVPTLIQMAVAYEGLKMPDKAKSHLEKALTLDPEDKIVHLKLKLLDRAHPADGA
jgi:tetratricopeptide (TPR) repeat protein